MKMTDWIMALSLVIIGLSCLTMSGTLMFNPESIAAYFNTLVRICFWIGIPIVLAGIVYMILNLKGKRK
jgi:hypothetical protein